MNLLGEIQTQETLPFVDIALPLSNQFNFSFLFLLIVFYLQKFEPGTECLAKYDFNGKSSSVSNFSFNRYKVVVIVLFIWLFLNALLLVISNKLEMNVPVCDPY